MQVHALDPKNGDVISPDAFSHLCLMHGIVPPPKESELADGQGQGGATGPPSKLRGLLKKAMRLHSERKLFVPPKTEYDQDEDTDRGSSDEEADSGDDEASASMLRLTSATTTKPTTTGGAALPMQPIAEHNEIRDG